MGTACRLLVFVVTLGVRGIAFAQGGGFKPDADYPFQAAFRYDAADRITALSLVECLALGRPDPQAFSTGLFDFRDMLGPPRPAGWAESVRVVDSIGLAKGSLARVIVPVDVRLTYPMVPGHRYLVLASLRPKRHPHDPDEIVGLAAFETHAAALDGSPDPADRIANSVADCLVEADDAGIHRTTQWLLITGYPGGGNYNNLNGREAFPLATKIRDLALGTSPHTRFETFGVLCAWHVFGSEQGWADAVIDLASEPHPLRPDDPVAGTNLQFSSVRAAQDPKYIPIQLDANRWADAVVAAHSDELRRLLIRKLARYPDELHLRKLARCVLAREDANLLEASVTYLSRVLKRPELAPERRNVNGTATWMNRDSSLAILRTLYGVAAP